MWPDLQKRVLHVHPTLQLWRGITSFVSKLSQQNLLSYKINDEEVLLPNFKALDEIQAELYAREKLNVCIS